MFQTCFLSKIEIIERMVLIRISLQIFCNLILIFGALNYWTLHVFGQSVENAGVAFVKGPNERNEFLEKNNQTVIYDEQARTNKAKD